MKEVQELKYHTSLNDVINRFNKTHFNQALVLDDA
jgi:hypothetical protein